LVVESIELGSPTTSTNQHGVRRGLVGGPVRVGGDELFHLPLGRLILPLPLRLSRQRRRLDEHVVREPALVPDHLLVAIVVGIDVFPGSHRLPEPNFVVRAPLRPDPVTVPAEPPREQVPGATEAHAQLAHCKGNDRPRKITMIIQ
jgi:hypothetical protein